MFSKNGSGVILLLSFLTVSLINNSCLGKPTPDPELDLPQNVTQDKGEEGASPTGAGDSPTIGSGATESDDPALECILDMITVMASGDEGDLSDSCKLMLGGMQETLQGAQTGSTSAPSTQATLADLQSQLHDLTVSRDSKLPDVDGDDINSDEESDLLAMKREEGHAVGNDASGPDQSSSVEIKSDKVQVKQDKQSAIADNKPSDHVTSEIESPFVTSLKDAADDYLVIPMKYLKKQLASGGQLSINEQPEVERSRQEVTKKSRADTGAKSDTMDSVEDSLDTDQSSSKQYEWNNPGLQSDVRQTEDVFNEERFDALYRVETDLIHLKEDLNHLKLSQRSRVL